VPARTGKVPSQGISIAIDGPASSGKGTIARHVAAALGYDHVDTGAMYRAVALLTTRAVQAWENAAVVARQLHFSFPIIDGQRRVLVNGEDVSLAIRGEQVGKGASVVAAIPEVRLALLDAQRALGRRGGVVMDGRDIGTVVLPNAELKIFLDADLEERARRRAKETGADVGMVLAEIRERDLRDSSRAVAPLKAADDAIHLDSTRLRIDEVVERVLALVEAGDGEM